MAKTLDEDFPPNLRPGSVSFIEREPVNSFAMLAAINVNDKVEKKNGLSYLSWAWAVDQLLRHDPAATWEYREPVRFGDTVMVFCTVTAFGKAMTAQLPVMNHRNQAIANPDSFAVNTAMQRCLAKAIALHGLGLYIYAGEDLPLDAGDSSEPDVQTPSEDWIKAQAAEVTKLHAAGELAKAYAFIKETFKHPEGGTDNDLIERMWQHVHSTPRAAIKAYSQLVHAKSSEALEKVWNVTPKHAVAALTETYEQRKAELSHPMEAAA